jgi:16S rRNA (uracil1498-N3)-methyltransferase
MSVRRVHVEELRPGEIELDEASGHHIARVLRLTVDTEVELFDDRGSVASATIAQLEPRVVVKVDSVREASANVSRITIAAAVPKGERADWMVEKLSELGCAAWIPLATARSVVLPEGRNKRERWMRIATESAKQSRRAGVMRIEELTRVEDAVASVKDDLGVFLSTEAAAPSIVEALGGGASTETRPASGAAKWRDAPRVSLFIGPEGGWSDEEIDRFTRANMLGLRLTDTILRVETAAIAAAAVVATWLSSNLESQI